MTVREREMLRLIKTLSTACGADPVEYFKTLIAIIGPAREKYPNDEQKRTEYCLMLLDEKYPIQKEAA